MLLKMVHAQTTEVVAYADLEFVGREHTRRLDDGALAVHPPRFDGIQPRTLDRQPTLEDTHTPCALDLAVVRSNPAAHLLADVPTRVVPHEHEHLLALLGHAR